MNGPANGEYQLNIEYSDDNITWNAIGQEINVYDDMVTKYGGTTTQTNGSIFQKHNNGLISAIMKAIYSRAI